MVFGYFDLFTIFEVSEHAASSKSSTRELTCAYVGSTCTRYHAESCGIKRPDQVLQDVQKKCSTLSTTTVLSCFPHHSLFPRYHSPDDRGRPGRRYDDDYDGPGARAEGSDSWRRTGPGGGGGGGGFDREPQRNTMAPEDGTWRSRAPPPRAGGGGGGGGGFDRDGGGYRGGGGYDDDRRGSGGRDRESGYNDPYGAPPASSAERPRLKLASRTAPPPMPPVAAKETTAPPAPAAKPSGPRSNPFGAAQAVDTTQRDKEIEAKAEAARQAALRRRDESIRSSAASPAGQTDDTGEDGNNEDNSTATAADENAAAADNDDPADAEKAAATTANEDGREQTVGGEEPAAPPAKPVGRWAALRREGGGDDRAGLSGGSFPRRDREDDGRRGSGSGGFEGRGRDDRGPYGRREEGRGGAGGFGSRMDREPVQPPAPPAGNAFAKRFGSNFDRESERSYPRPVDGGGGGGVGAFPRRDDDRRGGMGMGGGFDRRDDDRRGGMGGGGYERRDEGRMGGGGYDRRDEGRMGGGAYERRDEGRMGGGGGGSMGGNSRFSRDERSEGYQRRSDTSSPGDRPAPNVSSSLPSLSKMSISPKKSAPAATGVKAAAAAAPEPEPEPEVEAEPEPEPEPEPKEDPEEVARASAADAMATCKRGKELKDYVLAQEKKTTAGALLAAALKGNDTPQDMKWAEEDEIGAALTALSAENTAQQISIIYAVVAKCHEMGFPKVGGQAIVQTIFMAMYNSDMCEEEAFLEWKVRNRSSADFRGAFFVAVRTGWD